MSTDALFPTKIVHKIWICPGRILPVLQTFLNPDGWLSEQCSPVLLTCPAHLSCLPCPAHLSCLTCPASPVLLTCPASPVLPHLSCITCPAHLACSPVLLTWSAHLSCLTCPASPMYVIMLLRLNNRNLSLTLLVKKAWIGSFL